MLYRQVHNVELVFVGRDAQTAKASIAELPSSGRVSFQQCDATDASQLTTVLQQVWSMRAQELGLLVFWQYSN